MSEATLRRKIEIEEFLGYAKIHTAHHIAISVDVSDVPRTFLSFFWLLHLLHLLHLLLCLTLSHFVSLCLTLSHFVSGAQATGQRAREAEPTEAAKIRASAREKDTKLICQTHRSDRNIWHKYVTQTDIKWYKHYVLLTHGQGHEHGLARCYHNAWILDWIVRQMQTMAREIKMNKRPAETFWAFLLVAQVYRWGHDGNGLACARWFVSLVPAQPPKWLFMYTLIPTPCLLVPKSPPNPKSPSPNLNGCLC